MWNFKQKWPDQYLEELIGNLLQTGVILASATVILGGGIYLFRHGRAVPQYHGFSVEPWDLRSVSGIVAGVLAWRGRSIVQLGLLLLIATPVTRVALAAAAFAMQRDKLYTGIALVVLAILLFSLTSGQG